MYNQHRASCNSSNTEASHTIQSTSLLPRRPRLTGTLARRRDFVLRAVADLLLEDFGLLLDGAESVLDGVVGGAEVGGDLADVDLGGGQSW
jgi:hypothetical protein